MATYREVQEWVRRERGFVPKTCWIAHVLSDHNSLTRRAISVINGGVRRHPCPESKRPDIIAALKHFKMLPDAK
jgi:hypothetical protein